MSFSSQCFSAYLMFSLSCSCQIFSRRSSAALCLLSNSSFVCSDFYSDNIFAVLILSSFSFFFIYKVRYNLSFSFFILHSCSIYFSSCCINSSCFLFASNSLYNFALSLMAASSSARFLNISFFSSCIVLYFFSWFWYFFKSYSKFS